jgi:DNA-binding CsgD family transcriptional regulator
MDERIFRAAKRACYAGLDSVTLRRTVSERVAPLVRFDAYAFGTMDPDTSLLNHVVADGIPYPMMTAYVAQLYPFERATLDVAVARAGRTVFHAPELAPGAAHLGPRHGFKFEVDVVLPAAGDLWGKWCLQRADAKHALDRRLDQFLNSKAPHHARCLQHPPQLERALDASADVCDASTPGVLVLDHRNRPTLRTAAASAAFDDLADVGVDWNDGVPSVVRSLAVRMRAGRATLDGFDAPASVAVRARGRSGRWYTLHATRAEPDDAGQCALVITVRPVTLRERATLLSRLYGLSAREREIVAAVARGESTKDIARALAISPHTVTEHINRASDKIGVHGRKALVARLFLDAYAPTVGRELPASSRLPCSKTSRPSSSAATSSTSPSP